MNVRSRLWIASARLADIGLAACCGLGVSGTLSRAGRVCGGAAWAPSDDAPASGTCPGRLDRSEPARSSPSGPAGYRGTNSGKGEDRKKHTSETQSLMRNSYAVFCLKKKKTNN